MMTKHEMYDCLLDQHWLDTYSWRGLQMKTLEKLFDQDKDVILATMREIAHTHRNPDRKRLKDEKSCRSCGMPIVFMDVEGARDPHPCDVRQRRILTKRGVFETGRESHFASCPDADWWREKKK